MNCVRVRSGCEVDARDDGHYQETHTPDTQDTHRSESNNLADSVRKEDTD